MWILGLEGLTLLVRSCWLHSMLCLSSDDHALSDGKPLALGAVDIFPAAPLNVHYGLGQTPHEILLAVLILDFPQVALSVISLGVSKVASKE